MQRDSSKVRRVECVKQYLLLLAGRWEKGGQKGNCEIEMSERVVEPQPRQLTRGDALDSPKPWRAFREG